MKRKKPNDATFIHLYDQAYAQSVEIMDRLVQGYREGRVLDEQNGVSEAASVASLAAGIAESKFDRLSIAGLLAVCVHKKVTGG